MTFNSKCCMANFCDVEFSYCCNFYYYKLLHYTLIVIVSVGMRGKVPSHWLSLDEYIFYLACGLILKLHNLAGGDQAPCTIFIDCASSEFAAAPCSCLQAQLTSMLYFSKRVLAHLGQIPFYQQCCYTAEPLCRV